MLLFSLLYTIFQTPDEVIYFPRSINKIKKSEHEEEIYE